MPDRDRGPCVRTPRGGTRPTGQTLRVAGNFLRVPCGSRFILTNVYRVPCGFAGLEGGGSSSLSSVISDQEGARSIDGWCARGRKAGGHGPPLQGLRWNCEESRGAVRSGEELWIAAVCRFVPVCATCFQTSSNPQKEAEIRITIKIRVRE